MEFENHSLPAVHHEEWIVLCKLLRLPWFRRQWVILLVRVSVTGARQRHEQPLRGAAASSERDRLPRMWMGLVHPSFR